MSLLQRIASIFDTSKAALTRESGSFAVVPRTSNPPRRGTHQLIEIYNDSPWLRAVTSKVARGVAETRWRLYVPRDKEGKAIRSKFLQRATDSNRTDLLTNPNVRSGVTDIDFVEEILDHPVLDLLSLGNGNLLGFSAFQVTQTHIDLTGEAFWILERNSLGMPIAFWPLPPDWVYELPRADSPTYKIRPGANTTTKLEVPITEVLHFKDPNPSDPYGRGSGIGRALSDEIEIDEYAAKHLKSFFFNNARPDMIISGDNISAPDAARLEEQWLTKHQGFWNRFKPLFFSRRIDVKTLSQSFDNMQMVELRKQERDAFINVFGIPPEKLGVINESKRSTINAADFFWTKDIIKPRVELLRNFLQWQLIPNFDDRLIIDYDTPVLQDDEFKLQVMKTAPWAFPINEWRRLGGEESIDFGQLHNVPLNTQLLDVAAGEKPEPPTAPSDDKPPEDEDEEDPKDEDEDDLKDEDEDDKDKALALKTARELIAARRS